MAITETHFTLAKGLEICDKQGGFISIKQAAALLRVPEEQVMDMLQELQGLIDARNQFVHEITRLKAKPNKSRDEIRYFLALKAKLAELDSEIDLPEGLKSIIQKSTRELIIKVSAGDSPSLPKNI